MRDKYEAKGLKVIGIHTPEFGFEKKRSQVERVSKKHGSDYPIMMDNDYLYWKALNNRYWPTFYLVDTKGDIVTAAYGEMHFGSNRAEKFEKKIVELLP